MSHVAALPENQITGQVKPGIESRKAVRGRLSVRRKRLDALNSEVCQVVDEAGCPPTSSVQECLEFETLLANLSAAFIRTPARHGDSQIESALQGLVAFLGMDERSLLAAKLIRAQEEERRRIAREMHDDWTQRLALLGIAIAKMETNIGTPEVALPLLHTLQEELVKLSEDVHDLSRQLHPSILDDLGLVEAVRSECACFSRREGIAVNYQPEEVPNTFSKDVALCVYRIAQEALRNVAKHAAVDKAWVTLIATGSELLLRVRDKGVGFDLAGVRFEPGLGLSSMEERTHLIQAKLSITSASGLGTTVELRVPLLQGAS
jgi:signal transduction histidine kinase